MMISKMYRAAIIAISLLLGSIITMAIYHYFILPSDPYFVSKQQIEQPTILFWYDPMYPNTKFEQPGKSPFMDMDLVPKYAEKETGALSKPGIKIDPIQTQNLGLRTEKSYYGKLSYSQIFPANLDFNEYQSAIVQSRSAGFVEKIYPYTVGDKIKKGSPMIELTIPEWVEAQSEYLLLAATGASKNQLNGVLERLRLTGMPTEEIQLLRQSKKLQTKFIINAPIDGVITAFDLRTGMNISKDNIVANIQGINPIWINASIPESIAHLINASSQLTVTIPAFPGEKFTVQQWNILPSVDPITRTLTLRLHIDNENQQLKPGMNASTTLNTESKEMLLIPSQAVIDTGEEQRVITVDNDGRFVPKLVKIFGESQNKTALLSGLEEGELVVINGLFMIDSEANITGALDRMRQESKPMTDSNIATTENILKFDHLGERND